MKYQLFFTLIALLFTSSQALAIDGEISIGGTKFTAQKNGTWYQEEFPHTLHLKSGSGSVGVVGKTSGGSRYRVGYMYLGKATSSALAVASDEVYTKYRGESSKHYPLSHWFGEGTVQGVYATINPEIEYKGVNVGIEGGFHIYRATWCMVVPDWIMQDPAGNPTPPQPIEVHASNQLRIAPIVGITFRLGKTALAISAIDTWSDAAYPGIYGTVAYNVSIRNEF